MHSRCVVGLLSTSFPCKCSGLVNADYHIYLGVFYTLVGILLAALALCIVIGAKFKHNSFPYAWSVDPETAAAAGSLFVRTVKGVHKFAGTVFEILCCVCRP